MRLYCLILFFLVSISSIAQFNLVKDINTSIIPGPATEPRELVRIDETLYFTGLLNGDRGLLKYQDSISLVADVSSASASNPQNLVSFNGSLYFTAISDISGFSLFKTDGTPESTVLLTPLSKDLKKIIVRAGYLYFVVQAGFNESGDVWRTDGTPAGTIQLFSTAPSQSLHLWNPQEFNGRIYFKDNLDGTTPSVWSSDGTVAGLRKETLFPSAARFAVVFSDELYYTLPGGAPNESSLWKTDGTIHEEVDPLQNTFYHTFFIADSKLHFASYTTLYSLDSTGAFTLVASAFPSYVEPKVVNDSTIIYLFTQWNTQATAYNLHLRKLDLASGLYTQLAALGTDAMLSAMASVGDSFFLLITSPGLGKFVWQTDGTVDGTSVLSTAVNFAFEETIQATDTSLLVNDNGEVWELDVRNANRRQLSATAATHQGSSLSGLMRYGDQFAFTAARDSKRRLYISDGTANGTTERFEAVRITGNDTLIFFDNPDNSYVDQSRRGLFVWDGNSTKHIPVIPEPNRLENSMWFGKTFYYTASVKDEGWKQYLYRVEYPYQAQQSLGAGSLPVAYSGSLYFFLTGSPNQLMKKDSDLAQPENIGTVPFLQSSLITTTNGVFFFADENQELILFKVINNAPTPVTSFSQGRQVFSYAVSGNKIFFSMDDGIHGIEPWVSDGTAEGTFLLKDILPGTSSSLGIGDTYISYNNEFYFFLKNDGVHGDELWKSDGSVEGTFRLIDVIPGKGGLGQRFLINNGALYFVSDNALWRTTGKACGTHRVAADDVLKIEDSENKNRPILGNGTRILLEAHAQSTGWEPYTYDVSNDPLLDDTCKAAQSLHFSEHGVKNFGDEPFPLEVTTSSGLPITFSSSDSAIATIINGQVVIHKPGTITITATQAGNVNATPATAEKTFTFGKGTQYIIHEPIADFVFKDTMLVLAPMTSSGLPITLSSSSTNVTIEGNTVSVIEPGPVELTLQQAGSEFYHEVSRSDEFCVLPSQPAITMIPHQDNWLLISNSPEHNEWFFNGSFLEGLSNDSISVDTAGVYSVRVNVAGCVSTEALVTVSRPQVVSVFPFADPLEDGVITFTVSDFDIVNSTPEMQLVVDSGQHYTVSGTSLRLEKDYFGEVTAKVTVSNAVGSSDPFVITFNVLPVNDSPAIQGLKEALHANIYQDLVISLGDFLVTDPDNSYPEDHTLTLLPGDGYAISGDTLRLVTNELPSVSVSAVISDPQADSEPFIFEVTRQLVTKAENPQSASIAIYPNPNNGTLAVQLPPDDVGVLCIRDITGKTLYTYTKENRSTSRSAFQLTLSPGIYLATWTGASSLVNLKIFVN